MLFDKAVAEIIEKNPKGIVLDLRNNPGGYLNTAIEIASEWVEDGTIVTEQYNKEEGIETPHPAVGRARLKNIPTVVLVNGGSASASEIVSGALQDFNMATVIGTQTYGKGSVQTLQNLSDGSSLKITIAKWLTPKGRSINDEGIEPGIVIDYTIEDYRDDKKPQMEAAIKILNGEKVESQKKEKEENLSFNLDNPLMFQCKVDNDCVGVNKDCSSCDCDTISINKKFSDNMCKNLNGEEHCDKDCDIGEVECEDNKCTIK